MRVMAHLPTWIPTAACFMLLAPSTASCSCTEWVSGTGDRRTEVDAGRADVGIVTDAARTDAGAAADAGRTDAGVDCEGGLVRCRGICVDIMTDAMFCGACDIACARGFRCAGGSCEPDCPAGWSRNTVGPGRNWWCTSPTMTGNCCQMADDCAAVMAQVGFGPLEWIPSPVSDSISARTVFITASGSAGSCSIQELDPPLPGVSGAQYVCGRSTGCDRLTCRSDNCTSDPCVGAFSSSDYCGCDYVSACYVLVGAAP